MISVSSSYVPSSSGLDRCSSADSDELASSVRPSCEVITRVPPVRAVVVIERRRQESKRCRQIGTPVVPASLRRAFARSDRARKGVVMEAGRTRRAGSGFNAFVASPFHGRTASSSISHQRVGCIECALEYDNEPDLEEAYCPNCGARNPECVEWVALAELQAAEEAFSRGRSDPAG